MNNKHTCPKCSKSFNRNYDLQRHLKRKTPCDSDTKKHFSIQDLQQRCKGFACSYCKKSFYDIHTLERHLKNPRLGCYHQKHSDERDKQLEDKLNERDKRLKEELQNTITPPTIINNIQNNIKIVIVKQGEERIDHITDEKLLQIMDKDFNSAMRELMCLIYFNKEVPENSRWCVLYPTHKYGALQYNYDTKIVERWVTDKVLVKNFDNMLLLLSQKMDRISRSPNLSVTQTRNINKFFHHFGLDDFSNESPEGFDFLKMTAYNNRYVPIKIWNTIGIEGEHSKGTQV